MVEPEYDYYNEYSEKIETANIQAPKARIGLYLLLLLFLGLAIYSNTFSVPFHFDDTRSIPDNKAIHDGLNFHKIWDYSTTRFVTYFSFAINYSIGKNDVTGYHLVNIFIHLFCSFMVFVVVRLFFETPNLWNQPLRKYSDYIALFTFAIFLVHPIQTQAVTYIVQRAESLGFLFYLISIYFFLKARINYFDYGNFWRADHILFYIFSLSFVIIDMMTKETSFTLWFMIIIIEIVFFARDFRDLKDNLLYLIPFILTVFWGILLQQIYISQPLPKVFIPERDIYMCTELAVIMTYLRLLIFPVNQNLDYFYIPFTSIFHFPPFWGLIVIISLISFAFYYYKKDRLLSFSIFWFFIVISITSSIFPITDFIFEHRLYPAVFGFALFISLVFYYLISIFKNQKEKIISLFVIIILLFSFATYKRNGVWKDAHTLWGDTLKKSPLKPRPHYNMGVIYLSEGSKDLAMQEFYKVLELRPDHMEVNFTLGEMKERDGDYDEALKYFQNFVRIRPDDSKGYLAIGNIYLKQNKLDVAENYYKIAMNMDDNTKDEITNNLGVIYFNRGDVNKAILFHKRALELNPDLSGAYLNLGNCYYKVGNKNEAKRSFVKALELNGRYEDALYNLAIVFKEEGNYGLSESYLKRLLIINPNDAECYYLLGCIYKERGINDKASGFFIKALRLCKNDKIKQDILKEIK